MPTARAIESLALRPQDLQTCMAVCRHVYMRECKRGGGIYIKTNLYTVRRFVTELASKQACKSGEFSCESGMWGGGGGGSTCVWVDHIREAGFATHVLDFLPPGRAAGGAGVKGDIEIKDADCLAHLHTTHAQHQSVQPKLRTDGQPETLECTGSQSIS